MSCAREPTGEDQMGGRKRTAATCGTSTARQGTVTGRCVVTENTSTARTSAANCAQAHWQPQPQEPECWVWSVREVDAWCQPPEAPGCGRPAQCVCPEAGVSTTGPCTLGRLAAVATWHRSIRQTIRRR